MPRPWHSYLALSLLVVGSAQSVANDITPYDQLDWTPRAQLPAEHAQRLPSFCSGDYLLPNLEFVQDDALHLESDRGDFKEQANARFTGNVQLAQKGKQIQSDQLNYNQQTGQGQFSGNVHFRNQDIVISAEQLDYNSNTNYSLLTGTHYVVAEKHMRGQAKSIDLKQGNSAHLEDASYTFCEPGHNDWDIKASSIYLNQKEGYGEAIHGRLRIKEIPVLYMPYYRFPISEDRLTGFLNPEISFGVRTTNNDLLGTKVWFKQFATPFYWNIAPNYDDTFTPRYIDGHGVMAENEFRYLNGLGDGQIELSYLGNDESNDLDSSDVDFRDKERWSRAWYHQVNLTKFWNARVSYQEVSDVDYDNDFARTGIINRTSHLKQNAEVEFNNGQWQWFTRVEQSQTIDEAISANSKPFYRLPQVQLNKLTTFASNELQYGVKLEATRFTRSHNGVSAGVNNMDGERAHAQFNLSYPFKNTYSFFTPSLSIYSTQYSFQNLDSTAVADGYQDEVSRHIYSASVDGGLFFERNVRVFQQNFVQTLEPRLMLAYTPFEDQSDIPLFDTTQTSFSYGQLFNANRFTGLDRIGDTQQASLGLTTRFLNETGLEVFRASIGQIFYFEDRKVALNPDPSGSNTPEQLNSSSLAGEMQWLFADNWRFKADTQYNPNAETGEEPFEKASMQLNYLQANGVLFDMNVSHVESSRQKQVGLAFFAPISDRWAVYGQKKQDIYPYSDAEKASKEEDNLLNIEGLFGVEYQNCCWRANVTYEEHTRSDSTKDYQFLFQIHFKGLGILGSQSDDILNDRILGYDQRQIHDY